jgi:hypothetical protein
MAKFSANSVAEFECFLSVISETKDEVCMISDMPNSIDVALNNNVAAYIQQVGDYDKKMALCAPTPEARGQLGRVAPNTLSFRPYLSVVDFIAKELKLKPQELNNIELLDYKVKINAHPKYGRLESGNKYQNQFKALSKGSYVYIANEPSNKWKNDFFSFEVFFKGKKFEISYFLKNQIVEQGEGEESIGIKYYVIHCGKHDYTPFGGWFISNIEQPKIDFKMLTSQTLGLTTDNGDGTKTITLDDNGAGYGWYSKGEDVASMLKRWSSQMISQSYFLKT